MPLAYAKKAHKWYALIKLFKGCTWIVICLLLLQMVGGVAPITVTWLSSHLIDILLETPLRAVSFFTYIPTTAISCVILIGCFLFLSQVIEVAQGLLADYFKDSIYQRVQSALLRKIAIYPTQTLFEDPYYSNLITLAGKQTEDLGVYVSVASQVATSLFGLIPAIWIVGLMQWWIPCLLVITMVPLIYVKSKIEQKSWNIKKMYAPIFNQITQLEQVLTHTTFSKDIRMYGMQGWLLQKWNHLFSSFIETVNLARRSGFYWIAALSLVSSAGILVPLFYIVKQTNLGLLSLGQLVFFLGIILNLKSRLGGLIYTGGDIARTFYAMAPILDLLILPEIQDPIAEPVKKDILQPEISLKGVSFHYSTTADSVLKNVNFTIKPGENVAIVGENGSGKSTLVKLLCRLYEPSSGTICWNGHPIDQLEYQPYRENLNVLFQDFAQFPFTIRENLDVKLSGIDTEHLTAALAAVGLDTTFQGGLEQFLCAGIQNSRQLSGGQWQKLALARLFLNKSPNKFLILDEPTAALDPHAEYTCMQLIRSLMQQTTSIIISHRLALTRFVDTIIVLEKGQIIESGNHETLLAHKGLYHSMFTKQSSAYHSINVS